MRKKGIPKHRELVVCRIKEINPNSAFAELVEYQKVGMIHVSEIAKKWVKNIREFVKENQYVVCTVMNSDKDHISLSLKKVREEEAERKLKEFKRENRAEKALELIGKNMKMNLDEVYKEVGYKLQNEFGSLTKSFEMVIKNPDLFKKRKIPDKWIKEMSKTAKKMTKEKTHVLVSNLKLMSYDSDGVNFIKKTLKYAEKEGFEVRYISAPNYQIIIKGKNLQELQNKLEDMSKKIVNKIKKTGEADFKIEK